MPQEHTTVVDDRVQEHADHGNVLDGRLHQHEQNGYDQIDCLEDDLTERIKLKSEQVRLATFEKWPKSAPVRPEDLAREGFYYMKKEDQAKCIFCNLILKSWDPGDVVRVEHEKFNPNCPFLLRQNCGNVPINRPPLACASGAGSGSVAKYPEFSKPVAREETFRNVRISQNVDELVEAGFFYQGPEDHVKCFHCGITICHWERHDNPFTEHIHWSPSCEFAKRHPMANESFEVTPVVRRVLDMGYERELVRNAVQRRKSSSSSEYTDLNVLVDDLERLRTEQENVYGRGEAGPSGSAQYTSVQPSSAGASSSSSIETENKELKEKMLCKICMERDVAVTFIPCGHLVACEACGRKVKKCPMCRKNIRGYVKTFLS